MKNDSLGGTFDDFSDFGGPVGVLKMRSKSLPTPPPPLPGGGLGRLGVPFVQPVVASEAFFSHFGVFF